jgi:hypothetical protein
MRRPPNRPRRRPLARTAAKAEMPPASTSEPSITSGAVVDLAAYRDRRAWHAALDWLDAHGLCACWVMSRLHRGAS